MKKKTILLAITPILLTFTILIASQYIALYYTKQSINEFCNNLYQDKIYFSSMSTNIVSFRLSREIYNFPVNLQLINSFHQKIIEGQVKINYKHVQALSNIMRTYHQQEDLTIVQMIQKNPFLVNSWYQQNATELSQLELLAQEILKNASYLSPLVNSIGYYNQISQPSENYQRIPFKQIILSSTQDGILFSSFFNSSLSSVDDQNCRYGKFKYDPRCRFWYMNIQNQTSFYMNPPQISQGMTSPYLSQHGCQKMLFYNTTTNSAQIYKVQCIEAMISNIHDYFQYIIQSSKQYYIIDPRTLQILYNSRKQFNHSSLYSTDNLYDIEILYQKDRVSSQKLLSVIDQNFNKWNFLAQNNYTSINQMIDLSKKNIILDYSRNSSIYKVIINPVISYDDIPKHISKYTKMQGQQLQYVYLQINMISDEELKAQTNSLIEFSSKFFLTIQVILGILGIVFLLISAYYALKITSLIDLPLICLTQDLNRISQLNRMIEISEIINDFDKNSDELFLSLETQLLYKSFFELFQCVLYTSENFFVNNQGQTLIDLSKRVDFFTKFKNFSAVGIIHNNIGNILLNQEHYFQALEHFSLSIMYAKYEIQQFYIDNNIEYKFENIFQFYSFEEGNSQIQKRAKIQEHLFSNVSIFQVQKNSFTSQNNSQTSNEIIQNKQIYNNSISKNQKSKSKYQKNQQQFIKQKKRCSIQIAHGKYQTQLLHIQEKQTVLLDLIESLKSRMHNYIITLIAFQENLEQKNEMLNHFNFWPEIKYLVNDLIKVQSFLPQSESSQVLNLCLISKSQYRSLQFSLAEQKFQQAIAIIKDQEKQKTLQKLQTNISLQNLPKKNQQQEELFKTLFKNKIGNLSQINLEIQSGQQQNKNYSSQQNFLKSEQQANGTFDQAINSKNQVNNPLTSSYSAINSRFNFFSKNQICSNSRNKMQSIGSNPSEQTTNKYLNTYLENLSKNDQPNYQQNKIVDGQVKSNPQHIYAFNNAMKTYYQTEDQVIVKMIKKNQFLVNTWFQQNTTEVKQLEILAQEILKNDTYLTPLVKAIGYQNQLNLRNVNYIRIPYQQIIQSTAQDGILFSNFLNSSLSTIDDPKCYKGLFKYDPRCRFWYMNNLNQTSFFMNSPRISVGMTTPYLSQFGCQNMLFYNSTTKTPQIYKVQCLEAMLTNISSYFQNVIQSSKQYYIIDPRTLSILYNSKKQYNYSSLKQTDNFYNIELQYLQNKTSSQALLDIINLNFSQWTYLTQNNYTSIEQMIELSSNTIIIDYYRNSSIYKVILNPVISYDDIPKHISKYSKIKGQQLQYVYLQINMISDEDLRAQTNSLIDFSSQFFLIAQIILGVLALISLLISSYYAYQIADLIIQPLVSLTQDLNHINELNKMMEISEIIKSFDQNADDLFLSLETQLLYRSFFELFECVLYTSENFFVNNQGQTLLELSKKVGFFKKFGNNSAVGIIHNNIGNILLNQKHYFQALENFSLAIMYAKYEIIQFFSDNNINYLFDNVFQFYSLNETSFDVPQKTSEHQYSKVSIFSINKKNSSFSEAKNRLKNNSYNQEKQDSNQNLQVRSEATPAITRQQITSNSKYLTSQKQKTISKQNIQANIQISILQQIAKQSDSKEKQKQFFDLIESLKSRMHNYIITLIAFQENLEISHIDSKSFYFWPEIRLLLNDLIKVQQILPLNENSLALHQCLISKSNYRLFEFKDAEQKLQDAIQIIRNQQKQNNQLNLENNFSFLCDSQQMNTKKYKEQLQQNNQKKKLENFTQIYFEEQVNQQLRQKQSKGLNYLKVESPLTNKFENTNQSQIIFNYQLANSSASLNNSKQNLITSKNFNQNSNKNNTNANLTYNKNQNNFAQTLSARKSVSDYNQRYQIYNKILQQEFENQNFFTHQNLQKSLSKDLVIQFIKFSQAEYLIFRKQYKTAAEILTNLLENSKIYMSHMPYRIIFKDIEDIFKGNNEETQQSIKSSQDSFNCDEYVNKNANENLVKEQSLFHLITNLNKQIIATNLESLNKSDIIMDYKHQINNKIEIQTQEFENSPVNFSFNEPCQQPIFQENKFQNKQSKPIISQKNLINFQDIKILQSNSECSGKNGDLVPKNQILQNINNIGNYYFHNFIRYSLNQLFTDDYTFRLAEKNYYYSQKNQNDSKQNKSFASPNKLQLSLISNNRNTLKFIIYQTEKIELLDNCLFKSLCRILRNFGVQILIYSGQKGSNFLEKSEDSTYYYKEQEIIKIFYSHEKISQYLSFKRDQFFYYAYLTYIQNF
ncbi:hypothetical protein ABPG74_020464 [Tetrahymena malaccensis]